MPRFSYHSNRNVKSDHLAVSESRLPVHSKSNPRQRYNHQEEVVRNTVIGGVENAHMINIVV
jgi:hypothetical protein